MCLVAGEGLLLAWGRDLSEELGEEQSERLRSLYTRCAWSAGRMIRITRYGQSIPLELELCQKFSTP